MKRKCAVVFVIGILLLMVSACSSQNHSQVQDAESINQSQKEANNISDEEKISENSTEETNENDRINEQETEGMQMIIEVNGQQFEAELYDNDTVAALKNMLPMTLNMEEMNGNEKYYFMNESLPTASENTGIIQNGGYIIEDAALKGA